jgi:hypothetical protein
MPRAAANGRGVADHLIWEAKRMNNDTPSGKRATVSKDGDKVQCGWCGRHVANVGLMGILMLQGWQETEHGFWEPTPHAQKRYQNDRALAVGNPGTPPSVAQDARERISRGLVRPFGRPRRNVPGIFSERTSGFMPIGKTDSLLGSLPVRVRCLDGHVSIVTAELMRLYVSDVIAPPSKT